MNMSKIWQHKFVCLFRYSTVSEIGVIILFTKIVWRKIYQMIYNSAKNTDHDVNMSC